MIAQINLVAHTGLSVPFSSLVNSIQPAFLDSYWSNGINTSFDFEYCITKNIWLAPCIEREFYRWNNFNYYGPLPTEDYIGSAQGENSNVYRAMLEAKILASHKFITFNAELYFTIGLGYTIEKIGRIKANIIDFINGPSYGHIWNISYPNRSYWNNSLGVGTRTIIFGPIALDINAKYFTDYAERFYVSYNVGIAYSIVY